MRLPGISARSVEVLGGGASRAGCTMHPLPGAAGQFLGGGRRVVEQCGDVVERHREASCRTKAAGWARRAGRAPPAGRGPPTRPWSPVPLAGGPRQRERASSAPSTLRADFLSRSRSRHSWAVTVVNQPVGLVTSAMPRRLTFSRTRPGLRRRRHAPSRVVGGRPRVEWCLSSSNRAAEASRSVTASPFGRRRRHQGEPPPLHIRTWETTIMTLQLGMIAAVIVAIAIVANGSDGMSRTSSESLRPGQLCRGRCPAELGTDPRAAQGAGAGRTACGPVGFPAARTSLPRSG